MKLTLKYVGKNYWGYETYTDAAGRSWANIYFEDNDELDAIHLLTKDYEEPLNPITAYDKIEEVEITHADGTTVTTNVAEFKAYRQRFYELLYN